MMEMGQNPLSEMVLLATLFNRRGAFFRTSAVNPTWSYDGFALVSPNAAL
jgi:hypothetical protein